MSQLGLIRCLGTLLLIAATPSSFAESAILGVETSALDPQLKGLVLLEEMNCGACHSNAPAELRFRKAPRLADVGSRVNPHYIEAFIADPHGAKPGTTMPDVLAQQSEQEKKIDCQSNHSLSFVFEKE